LAQTPQTIAFDPIPNQILGVSPFPIFAEVNSNLPEYGYGDLVTTTGLYIGFNSNTPAVCRVAVGQVFLLSAGTCSLTASQSGGSGYSAATPVTQSFTVSAAKQ
jgi:hypothetical protein